MYSEKIILILPPFVDGSGNIRNESALVFSYRENKADVLHHSFNSHADYCTWKNAIERSPSVAVYVLQHDDLSYIWSEIQDHPCLTNLSKIKLSRTLATLDEVAMIAQFREEIPADYATCYV
jgi:hypothetical protein